jgi:DNA repair protein RecO (recombination protein O)
LTFSTKGIVIRESETGESDKSVVIITKSHGKIFVHCRGARKPKSKFLAGAQLFTYSNLIIYEGRGFYSLAQADVIENFYMLREDLDKLYAAVYFCEIYDKTIMPGMDCSEFGHLLLVSLAALVKGKQGTELIKTAFNLKFFHLFGVAPETEACVNCGKPPDVFGKEGAFCLSCASAPFIKFSKAAFRAVRYVLDARIPEIFNFSVDQAVLKELEQACNLVLRTHFTVQLKSQKL